MKTFNQLVSEGLENVDELFPWDLSEALASANTPLLLDIREADEFEAMHIKDSINIPRGILESACEFGYAETEPRLASARNHNIVVICRSGNRSVLATLTLNILGFQNVKSLKTGLRGWNDDERALHDQQGNAVDIDVADKFFSPEISAEQMAESP